MVGTLVAVAMMSTGLAVVPTTIQKAEAHRIRISTSNKIKWISVVALQAVLT
jgi:hypothetical protein